MPLIKCPECGKDISSFAESCPYCGIGSSKIKEILDTQKYNVIFQYSDRRIVEDIIEVANVSHNEAVEMIISRPSCIKRRISFFEAEKIKAALEARGAHIAIVRADECTDEAATLKKYDTEPVRCPKCKSTEFSTGARGFSMWSGFVGAGKTVNRCAKCGYTWKP